MLSKEKIQEKVFNNSLETCDYISGYENKYSIITLKCKKHNYIFSTKYENISRGDRPHLVCPLCQKEKRQEKSINHLVELECAYCGKTFTRAKSKLDKSKSGLYFCCREHKDLAQRIESGIQFQNIRPNHYGKDSLQNYRQAAFRTYLHECAICKWNEDEDILEVHHINSNHQDNRIENLIILCPICHRKLTSNKYILQDMKIIKIK